jgi:hypothetical protein
LFEEFDRQIFFGSQFTYLEQGTSNSLSHAEINKSTQGIFTPFGELHWRTF